MCVTQLTCILVYAHAVTCVLGLYLVHIKYNDSANSLDCRKSDFNDNLLWIIPVAVIVGLLILGAIILAIVLLIVCVMVSRYT